MENNGSNARQIRNSVSIHDMLNRNRNDPVALRAFNDRYRNVVREWASRRTDSPAPAEFVANRTMEKLVMRITNPEKPLLKLNKDGSFQPYIKTVMMSVIADLRRHENGGRTRPKSGPRNKATPEGRVSDDPHALSDSEDSPEDQTPQVVWLSDKLLATLESEDSLEDLENRWDAQVELERVMNGYLGPYRKAVAALKTDSQYHESSWRMFLAVYREGIKVADLTKQGQYRPGTVTKTVKRVLDRLMGLMWEDEPEPDWKQELLLEMVRTYGDPSDGSDPPDPGRVDGLPG